MKDKKLSNKIKIISLLSDKMKKKILINLHTNLLESERKLIGENLKKDEDKLEVIYQAGEFSIVKSLEKDENKLKCLEDLYWNDRDRMDIIRSLKSDEAKIRCLSMFEYDVSKVKIIQSLQSDQTKIDFLEIFEDDFNKSYIIQSLKSDEAKINCLYMSGDYWGSDYRWIIQSFESDETKRKLLDDIDILVDISKKAKVKELSDEEIIECSEKLFSDNAKIGLLELSFQELIGAGKSEDGIPRYERRVAKESDVIFKMKFNNPKAVFRKLRQNAMKQRPIVSSSFIRKHIEEFFEKEEVDSNSIEDKKRMIQKMEITNDEIWNGLNFEILDPKYVDTLGLDKINLIGCYPEIQNKILNLKDDQYELFAKCLNEYMNNHYENTEEWTVVCNSLLNNLPTYKKLAQNIMSEINENKKQIEDINFEKITKILENSNDYNIETLEDVERYEEIVKNKADDLFNNAIRKKKGVILKIFGHDDLFARKIIEKYGSDIEKIGECDEKDYVIALKEILNITDEEVLEEIYKCPDIEFIHQDKIFIERALKSQYGKMFNDGLLKPENLEKVEGEENIYQAGTDFKMIITSIGAHIPNHAYNYESDWNRDIISSQHISTSYIRNDMIGTIAIKKVCYGFYDMADDALMAASPNDLGSSLTGFETTTRGTEKYYIPDELINHTDKYNELDFRRIQNGIKKQPDYIVVFDSINLEEAKKASNDFGRVANCNG